MLSHDAELIALARKRPEEFDVHAYNASLLFQIAEGEVTRRERQGGKRIVHASNYDAQPQRISDALLDEGFVISVKECAERQAIYHARFPAIRNGYHLRTRMLIIQQRALQNSWDFRIEFKYERLDAALFRRAYAWRPQSEVGYLLNQYGLIPIHDYIQKRDLPARPVDVHDYLNREVKNDYIQRRRLPALRFQVHDEVALAVAEPRTGWDLIRVLRDSLEREREYEGERLAMPADFALERRYHGVGDDTVEWKRFPGEQEFTDAWGRLSNG